MTGGWLTLPSSRSRAAPPDDPVDTAADRKDMLYLLSGRWTPSQPGAGGSDRNAAIRRS